MNELEMPPTNGPTNGIMIKAFGEALNFFVPAVILANAVATEVPTLSEWGLIAMAGVLGVVGFMVVRRKRATA